MEKRQDKSANEEEKKEVGKISWSAIILMISIVVGVLLLKLILE
jgi:hypothetical protein